MKPVKRAQSARSRMQRTTKAIHSSTEPTFWLTLPKPAAPSAPKTTGATVLCTVDPSLAAAASTTTTNTASAGSSSWQRHVDAVPRSSVEQGRGCTLDERHREPNEVRREGLPPPSPPAIVTIPLPQPPPPSPEQPPLRTAPTTCAEGASSIAELCTGVLLGQEESLEVDDASECCGVITWMNADERRCFCDTGIVASLGRLSDPLLLVGGIVCEVEILSGDACAPAPTPTPAPVPEPSAPEPPPPDAPTQPTPAPGPPSGSASRASGGAPAGCAGTAAA